MISLLFFKIKPFDLSISQLKDVIKLTEVIGKSIIDNECQILYHSKFLEFSNLYFYMVIVSTTLILNI